MAGSENMTSNANNRFSANASALGYMFQCRYALLESLERLRKCEEFTVSIETLDDVVFEANGIPTELIQTKHQINRSADLTDASPDLWKTIRIWCEGLSDNTIPDGTMFFLITTAQAADGSAAFYLKADNSRDINKGIERLASTAESSTNRSLQAAFRAFKKLSREQHNLLFRNVIIFDCGPTIVDLDKLLRSAVYGFAERRFIDSFLNRMEGWWFRRAIRHLAEEHSKPILSEELEAETSRLREQFKLDSLPIDDDIMSASVDASGYQDKVFVHQLRLIEIGNPRILYAIRNYFRAFEQRSRWIREDLLLVGELDRYEEKLIEEWELFFHQMRDDIGDNATEVVKKEAAQSLYKWVETGHHHFVRQGVTEASISRGSYQMLSDQRKVGWHPDYAERIRNILERQEV